MSKVKDRHRFFAEEIEAIANLRTSGLVAALALVPRERFLPPGPWVVTSEGDSFGLRSGQGAARRTADADPQRVYHNYSIAIDAKRELFNGAPGVVVPWIDALELKRGSRVLHIGAGLGYYSALIGHVVGSSGRVVAIEIDAELAEKARTNVELMPWIHVQQANGTGRLTETFDSILVSVGTTHPQNAWLDALAPGGRMVVPLTATMSANSTLSKGLVILLMKAAEDTAFGVRVLTFVSIYSGLDLRDEATNTLLGKALARGPFPSLNRLRSDTHDPSPTCWLHAPTFCLELADAHH